LNGLCFHAFAVCQAEAAKRLVGTVTVPVAEVVCTLEAVIAYVLLSLALPLTALIVEGAVLAIVTGALSDCGMDTFACLTEVLGARVAIVSADRSVGSSRGHGRIGRVADLAVTTDRVSQLVALAVDVARTVNQAPGLGGQVRIAQQAFNTGIGGLARVTDSVDETVTRFQSPIRGLGPGLAYQAGSVGMRGPAVYAVIVDDALVRSLHRNTSLFLLAADRRVTRGVERSAVHGRPAKALAGIADVPIGAEETVIAFGTVG